MEAPFDRGEVDRASLDATERLRARLSGRSIEAQRAPRQRSMLPWAVAGGLLVFSAGMIANPWFERNVRDALPFSKDVVGEVVEAPAVESLQKRLTALEAKTGEAGDAVPVERLARTEAKIETSTDQIARDAERIDDLTAEVARLQATIAVEQAREAAATAVSVAAAERAQGLLTLVLVRRAVDGGRTLGPLETVMRQSFEARYPQAVQSVAALGAAPVTPASLRRDFAALRPSVDGKPASGARLSWWDTLTGAITSAVSSPEGDPAPTATDAAAAALARGDVAAAAAQVRRLPMPRSQAVTNWLSAANRYLLGSQALATLETAAVLAPAPVPVPVKTAEPAEK